MNFQSGNSLNLSLFLKYNISSHFNITGGIAIDHYKYSSKRYLFSITYIPRFDFDLFSFYNFYIGLRYKLFKPLYIESGFNYNWLAHYDDKNSYDELFANKNNWHYLLNNQIYNSSFPLQRD